MKMEQTECFETSAYTIQTPGNYPEENKKKIVCLVLTYIVFQIALNSNQQRSLGIS